MSDLAIVVCLGDFVARVDARRGRVSEILASSRVDAPRGASLAQRVGSALRSLGRARSVIVFTDEAYAAEVELDAIAIRGLSHAELCSALACEVQLSSGLGAEETAIEWRTISDRSSSRSFRLVEIARRDLEGVADAARLAGARLLGVSHPDEVPTRLPADRESALDGAEWAAWFDAALGSLARERVLSIPAPRAPLSTAAKAVIACVCAFVVLAFARFDHRRVTTRTGEVKRDTAVARAPMEELTALHAESQRLEIELRELRERLPRSVEAAGPRWRSEIPGEFLRAIASDRPSGVRVYAASIAASGGTVEGIAARIESIDELQLALERKMAPHGVTLALASRRLVEQGVAAGLYRFRLVVRPISRHAAAESEG